MDRVDGVTLHDHIAARGGLTGSDAAVLGARVAEALAHCQQRGVAHHDLKPANIVLTDCDVAQPVLVDWGLAGGGLRPMSGTPPYMAPECWVEGGPSLPGGPVDIFALGCTLFEARTGRELLGGPLTLEDVGGQQNKLAYNNLASNLRHSAIAHELATNHEARKRRVELGVPERDMRELIVSMVKGAQPARPRASAVAEKLRIMAGARRSLQSS
jgi:serine/threonine protein kinase